MTTGQAVTKFRPGKCRDTSAVVYDRTSANEWLQTARRTARHIFVEGMPWLVYELPPAPFDRRSATSLVFEAENTVRRVRTFPADWRDLSDDDLFALSWNL